VRGRSHPHGGLPRIELSLRPCEPAGGKEFNVNRIFVAVFCGVTALVSVPTALAADPVIAAAGDISCATTDPNYHGGNGDSSHCAQRRTADVIGRIAPDAVLPLGARSIRRPWRSTTRPTTAAGGGSRPFPGR
jgi:hypothetical protein